VKLGGEHLEVLLLALQRVLELLELAVQCVDNRGVAHGQRLLLCLILLEFESLTFVEGGQPPALLTQAFQLGVGLLLLGGEVLLIVLNPVELLLCVAQVLLQDVHFVLVLFVVGLCS